MKKTVFIIFLIICFVSCKSKSDMELFDDFAQKKSVAGFIILQTLDVNPEESLDKNYRKIIKNKANALFLFEKAKSTTKTQYCIPILHKPLTEGDVAICMLCDMYKISDEYFQTVMYENIKRQTNTAEDFWNYVQASEENRNEIIQKISDWVKIYTADDFLFPWTEEEVLNHSFELISDTKIENFVFSKLDDGTRITSCTYGKKDSYLTGPIEYWKIEDGYLYIYPYEEVLSKKQIKIGKIRIDKENKILYGYRNYKKVTYKYE